MSPTVATALSQLNNNCKTSPAGGMTGEIFSARWRGQIAPEFGETYTFKVVSDGGVRLWVNGQLVIDQAAKHANQAVSEDSGTIALAAGELYDIKLEYTDAQGDATVKLKWASASQSEQIIPQDKLHLPAKASTYGYDAVGNRLAEAGEDPTNDTAYSRSFVYDPLNRLSTLTDVNGTITTNYGYSYDPNGNLTTAQQNGAITANYDYDARDQLRKYTDSSGNASTYDYDFSRKRLSRTTANQTLRYVYAGDTIVNDYRTVLGEGGADNLLNRYDLGDGEVIRAELTGSGDNFYFSDAQGSTTALSNLGLSGAASINSRYEYDAFGNITGSTGGSSNAIGYTGQRHDNESGLMALGNGERYYAPGLGRFIQQDSFTGRSDVPPSLNRYSYVHNNPVIHTDPTGHIVPLLLIGAALISATAVSTGTVRAHAEHNYEGEEKKWAANDPRRSWGSALGDGSGMTKVVNAAVGQDVYTSRDLSQGERFWEGVLGAVEVVGNAAGVGGAVFKGGSVGLNLARGGEAAWPGARASWQGARSAQPFLDDITAVGQAARNPLQTGRAAASHLTEGYQSVKAGARALTEGGARQTASRTWQYAKERLNPLNYRVERNGWDVNVGFSNKAKVGQVNYGSTDLSRTLQKERLNLPEGPESASNLAAFEYADESGNLQTLTGKSSGIYGPHSERVIANELSSQGIDNSQVTRIYSELEPCTIPRGCKGFIQKNFPQAKVTYSFEYGSQQASRDLGNALRREAFTNLSDRFNAAQNSFGGWGRVAGVVPQAVDSHYR